MKVISPFAKIIGSNLLNKREEKRYTQAYMAILCEMSQPNYSDIERGKREPTISQLIKFAEIFGTTVDVLVRSHENKASVATDHPKANKLTPSDTDTYIAILENQVRNLLQREKEQKKALSP